MMMMMMMMTTIPPSETPCISSPTTQAYRKTLKPPAAGAIVDTIQYLVLGHFLVILIIIIIINFKLLSILVTIYTTRESVADCAFSASGVFMFHFIVNINKFVHF